MKTSNTLFSPSLFATALGLILSSTAFSAPTGEQLIGPTGITAEVGKNQIQVLAVDQGSPAAGKLKKGDVIIGAGDEKFSGDVRGQIAAAIERAESNGKLSLTLKGGTQTELQLKELGSFSKTAPWDCPKTNAIITRTADRMLDTGDFRNGGVVVGWIGLMATGEDKYLDVVKKELPKQNWAVPQDTQKHAALLKGEIDMGYIGWYWGYQMIALAEYHLLSGDRSVLPALESYALTMVRGQDGAGIWGHRLATEKRNGRLPGYAHINNPSLSTLIGIQLALKCPIGNKEEIQKGADRSVAFYKTFAGEGSLPYGVHDPNTRIFNNNGSSAMAALVMAFAGEKEAARYFSQQAAAAWDIQETGHATHYFNILWTPLGANVAGPEVSQAFFNHGNWVRTLYRKWDGEFTLNGKKQKSCDDNGSLLLAYCLPRKVLHITGKNADQSLWVKGAEVAKVVEAGQIDYKKLSVEELLVHFGNPAPQVRRNAVWELRNREGDFIPKVAALATGGTDFEQRSAMEFFGYQCPPEWALPHTELIGKIVRDEKESPKVRAAAANALAFNGETARKFLPDMLRMVIAEEPDDEFGIIDMELAASIGNLAPDPFDPGLALDKKLIYQAALKLADHPRQGARSAGLQMLRTMPKEDFHLVADKVKYVIEDNDPNYHSYHNPTSSVAAAAMVLAKFDVKEGLEWSWDMLESPDGKAGFKARAILDILTAYGPSAKPYLEKIRADEKLTRLLSAARWKGKYDAMVKAVEGGKAEELIPFEEAKKRTEDSVKVRLVPTP